MNTVKGLVIATDKKHLKILGGKTPHFTKPHDTSLPQISFHETLHKTQRNFLKRNISENSLYQNVFYYFIVVANLSV